MKPIEWSEKYSVGIPEVDAHHMQLIKYINLLDDSIAREMFSKEFVSEVVDGLFDYAHNHFSLEEGIMKKHGYPGFKDHQSEHAVFLKDVHAFRAELEKGSRGLVDTMAHYLKSWLIRHILVNDKEFSDYCLSKGLDAEEGPDGH